MAPRLERAERGWVGEDGDPCPPRLRNRRAEDHARPDRALGSDGLLDRLHVAEAVLQRHHHAGRSEEGSNGGRDQLRVVRFHRKEDGVEGASELTRFARQPETGGVMLAPDPVDGETAALDRLEVRGAAEEGDVDSGLAEKATEHRAERPGSGDEDSFVGHARD
jgi:hypothetical protein